MEAIFFLVDLIVLYLILIWSMRADLQDKDEPVKGWFRYGDQPNAAIDPNRKAKTRKGKRRRS